MNYLNRLLTETTCTKNNDVQSIVCHFSHVMKKIQNKNRNISFRVDRPNWSDEMNRNVQNGKETKIINMLHD